MSKRFIFLTALLASLLILSACTAPEPAQPTAESEAAAETPVPEAEAEAVHWGYEGEGSPENWGSLDPEYIACSEGMVQSPVDITADAPVNPDDVGYAYDETAVNIVNNGHAIQVNVDEGSSSAEIDGTAYTLQQFHFHSPSEHTLAGENVAMEMHLVHADADGNNAVVSVMLVEGAENPAFDPIWENMPAEEGEPITIDGVFVDPDDLLPEDRDYYHYIGSLTTPACTEGVNWHVLEQTVELSADQIAQFRAIHDGTNRPIQPMNGREFLGAEEAEAVHWGYEGEGSPENWGSLDPAYIACSEGMTQSPVDVLADAPVNPDDVGYAYDETAVNIVNNGHAIQVNVDEGSSSAEIDGTAYTLQQFHFHSPSEHTLAGENVAMEMHLVHADADGNNAVVSVMLVEGAENPAFDPIWENMPAEEGEPITIDGVFVDPDDLLPEDRDYYHYIGSLTTPACTEGVNWHVLEQTVELSADQIAQFRAIHDGTNRPIQPMNGREFLGAEEAEAVHWGYEGEGSPENWGSLDPAYIACSEGMTQSPVDVLADAPVNPDDVGYAYDETAVNIVNNGHAIQVNVDENSGTAEIDGTTYMLQQFHFHSPSEHTLAGENVAMEMHLVHADADGNNAVVSVMLVEGAENPAFDPIWENMPAEEGEPIIIDGVFVDPDDLLPEDRDYYHYIGSLTTPACTEGVNWHVLEQTVELSADQIAQFRAIHDGTNRPIQPMNGREFLGAEEAEAVHWGYEGEGSPENWGSLDPAYIACSEGMTQSPVDVLADAPVNPDDVGYAYDETAVNIVNNGHAIQVNVDENSGTAEIDGTTYMLQQFHFHSPSEHTLAGENVAMEMHLVHADADGNNAVVSVMLVEGAENPAFDPIWENMPAEEGEPIIIDGVFVDPDDLLPEDRDYYHYIGSLTTPACTEGVNWHVLEQTVELSADQIAQFRAIHDGTNRPIQPMNGREFLGAEEAEAVHWGYEGEGSPENWGSLDPAYIACSEGMTQSPVDVLADAPVNPDDVGYAYDETAVNIVNNGHAIQVNVDENSGTAEIDGTTYMLQQFHFHSPSEHTLAGENVAMEMHLVHADADGNNAVVSVMLVEGAENPAFDPIWENMPAEEGEPIIIDGVFVDPDDLLPEDRDYYHYIGSLTTPACTEGVNWHVLEQTVELSADQIAQFRAIHDGTNRPIQPMNGREFLGAEE